MPAIIRPRNADGSFGTPEKFGKGETDQEKIERLEAANAQIAYESIMKDLKIDELESNQALLTYQLLVKGVL